VALVLVAAAVLVSVPLAGGHLGRLAALRLRGALLVAAALAVQVLVISVVPGLPAWAARGLHLGSYALAGAFFFCNRRVPGLWLVGLGAAANAVAIAANGGVMPAAPAALRAAGRVPVGEKFANSAAVEGARLPWLGDVFATPSWFPLHNVFSVGDVAIVVGMLVVAHRACGSDLWRGRRRRLRRPAGSASVKRRFLARRPKGEVGRVPKSATALRGECHPQG
jgi:hypothetical protein